MTEAESRVTSRDRIIRRKGQNYITEGVERWHTGPGVRGMRSYLVLYCPDGRVRIDVCGPWGSFKREMWMEPEEVRPTVEWAAHLKATGQTVVEPRWCAVDGMEVPQERIDREIPGEPEEFCSRECARQEGDKW